MDRAVAVRPRFLFFKRQAIYALVGGVAALGVARLPYQVWQRAWRPLLVLTLILLALVLHPATGTTAGGASRCCAAA